MIKYIIAPIITLILIIIALSIYLQPDEIRQCDVKPSITTGCESVDAIVAISGGDTTARTKEAISLFKNGWANKLILSGAAQDKTGPSNAAVMKKLAIDDGVPESAIIIDEYSETTEQNAENSNKIFTSNNIKKVIVVTSGYHQRRAGLEFTKRTQNIVILNHPTKTGNDWSFWWWVTPTGWYLAISEIVKIVAFYVLGIFG
jgi:uncharacterized SAM-binding protein YcdF (DUF218 family)